MSNTELALEEQKNKENKKEKQESKNLRDVLVAVLFFIGVALLMSVCVISDVYKKTQDYEALDAKYGEDNTLEDEKAITYNKDKATRYFITTPSKDKVVNKGYYVIIDKNHKIVVEQELSNEELNYRLAKED